MEQITCLDFGQVSKDGKFNYSPLRAYFFVHMDFSDGNTNKKYELYVYSLINQYDAILVLSLQLEEPSA